jgi:hypothetical protein
MKKPAKKRNGDSVHVAYSVMRDVIGISNKPIIAPGHFIHALQFLPDSPDIARYPGDGSGDFRSRLDNGGNCGTVALIIRRLRFRFCFSDAPFLSSRLGWVKGERCFMFRTHGPSCCCSSHLSYTVCSKVA